MKATKRKKSLMCRQIRYRTECPKNKDIWNALDMELCLKMEEEMDHKEKTQDRTNENQKPAQES